MRNPAPLPRRQIFRAHERERFNAALARAAKQPGYLITVEIDDNGDTVAIIHRGAHRPQEVRS
jgi:hypothetical protein